MTDEDIQKELFQQWAALLAKQFTQSLWLEAQKDTHDSEPSSTG